MNVSHRSKIVAAVAAGVAVVAAGGAVAASKLLSPSERSQAIVDDAAQQLGVAPAKLSAALKKALENQVDADVAAGRITKEQGDELKQRIESGHFPILGGGPRGFGPDHHGFGHHGPLGGLDEAATYLGVTEDQLRTELMSGKTLAEVAKAHGKSVDGLVNALVAAAKTHIDAAVKAGRLTQAQADEILKDVQQRVTDRVNGVRGGPESFRGFRGGDSRPDFGGPPPPPVGPPA